jgi:acetyl esterase/lipase
MTRRGLMIATIVSAFVVSALAPRGAAGADVSWKSVVTGGQVGGQVVVPASSRAASSSAPLPTVIYLKGLSIPRIGRDSDESILADLTNAGHLVLVLDYAHQAKAVSPDLQTDVLNLRRDVAGHKLLADHNVDLNRLFILPEGFRLMRDVEFARDGERVLAMDVSYPSRPSKRVATLMEITCDNANRMGTGSLVFCHDTLLEGATFAGFAAAMIDHPVRPPYKGIDDPMPECLFRLKAAVRTLRSKRDELGLSGEVGAMGFSRGSNMAALLATTGGRADLEGNGGAHPDVSSRVQAALVHGARFDFTELREDDPMLARFAKAWGVRDANRDRWAAHGALHYLNRSDCAPMFLNTSDAESPEFRHGLALLASRLKQAGVQHEYSEDSDGRGHHVSTDPKTLLAIYAFFAKHLADDGTATGDKR